MVQEPIARLRSVAAVLDDGLDEAQLDEAAALIDRIAQPLSPDDLQALTSLLPAGGDTAYGLNWSILHAIEASPEWPVWDLLEDPDHEWVRILRIRLENGGYPPPVRVP